jgi:DHA2 family multidrug resistance protein
VSFAPSIGPTLGGYITEYLDWRWVFFINIPFGVLTVISALFFLPETSLKRTKESLNFISFTFLSIFTVSRLILLSKGQQYSWFNSDFIVYLFITSIFALLLYLLSEFKSEKPLIDFSIFKDKNFFVGFSVYFLLLGFSMYQLFYLIPIYFENLKQLSTLEAGIHILGMAFFIALFSPIAGLLSDKIGEKYVLYMAGILYIFSAIFILPSLDYFTPSLKGALMLIPLGTSMGMFFAPATTLALRNLGEKTSLGTGLLHYSRFIGGSFGTAIATNNLYKYSYEHFDGITQMQNTSFIHQKVDQLKSIFSQSFDVEHAERLANAIIYKVQSLYALSWSFQDTFFIAGLWGVLGAMPLLVLVYTDIRSKFKFHLNKNCD